MKKLIQKKCFLCALILMHTVFMLQAQNTSNPHVGAIPGVIDVSPMGAATYTIPIEVVPGTQGMQPNLSIAYNSFGGMGILGMKWSLTGLSAITRTGQIPYYDNNIATIQFNLDDKFAIDGNRLIQMSNGAYGGNGVVYATEMENFTRVFSYGKNDGPPEYFVACTDDGTVIEYGRTSTARQKLGADNHSILCWFVTKITDFNGNFMTFHYGQSPENEIWIENIQYTGNTGIPTYAKVVFDYDCSPAILDKNTCFVSGYAIPLQTRLLKSVTAMYKDTVVRKYEFKYVHETVQGERTAHLKEVVLYGVGGIERLNATTMEWGEKNDNTGNLAVTLSDVPNGKIITGDFNGDGYTDYVIYGQGEKKDVWKLYTGSETGTFTATGIGGTHQGLGDWDSIKCLFYSADFTGNGFDNLIIADYANANIKVLSIKNGVEVILNETRSLQQVFFGDFDGDGRTDILVYDYFFSLTVNEYIVKIFSYDDDINKYVLFSDYGPYICIPVVSVGDFNGDGLTDIRMHRTDGYWGIYTYNLKTKRFVCYQDGWDYLGRFVYSGDFNGDGITDILTFDIENYWQLRFGIFDTNPTNIPDLIKVENSQFFGPASECLLFVPACELIIADINGDGKDDIIQTTISDDSDSITLKILYSKGCIDGQYQYDYEEKKIYGFFSTNNNVCVADFNNDGILNLIIKDKSNKPSVLYFHKNKQYEFVKLITDGLGKKIKLTYKPKYYYALSDEHAPLLPTFCSQKHFLATLDTLHVSNGLNGFSTWKYQYNTPLFNLLRREFLGFKVFACINNQENKKNENIFQVDGVKKILQLFRQRSYCGIKQISEKEYNYFIVNLPGGRFAFKSIIKEYDLLSNSAIEVVNTVNNQGRLIKTQNKTYNGISFPNGNYNMVNLLLTEEKNYYYKGICGIRKTVPDTIITTQQYANSSSNLISDTLTFGYFPSGRLEWEQRSNRDGAVKTTYSDYTNSGLWRKKTVSAAGCDSRSEEYVIDPTTHRFVTQIKNPINHISKFEYDAKTGNKTKETDPNGLITTYKYDNFGNLTQVNYPDGTQSTISVSPAGSLPPNAKYYTTTKTSGKSLVRIYYDILSREVCRFENDAYFHTLYNNKGQVVSTCGPLSSLSPYPDRVHEYSYDGYGRKLTEKAPYTDLEYIYDFGSRKIKVKDLLRDNIESWKNYDALGRVIEAKDEGGMITYDYSLITENGKTLHQTIISSNGAATTMKSDLWGNRLSITDPDAGLITSTYNGFSELVTQVNAKGDITSYQYDKLGRVTQKKYKDKYNNSQTITYTYDIGNKALGQLYQIKTDGTVAETFTYDNYSRLSQHEKLIDGYPYKHKYSYTPNGQLDVLTYPDNFAVKYKYTSTGKLSEITRSDNNSGTLIYKVHNRNDYQLPVGCEYGNELGTIYTYNHYGMITGIRTGNKWMGSDTTNGGGELPHLNRGLGDFFKDVDSTILNYRYTYDTKGLMVSRSESILNLQEKYTYDHLDRLVKVVSGKIGAAGTPQTFTYANNGNINSHSVTGNYIYGINGNANNKPHAVTKITNSASPYNPLDVTYNFYNQPVKIESGTTTLNLTYGANQQRQKAVKKENNEIKTTHNYISKYYETEADSKDYTTHYHYIYGDNGVVALYMVTPRLFIDSMYYIHTDHLGSYCAITSQSKRVMQRGYFDPWGNFLRIMEPVRGIPPGEPPVVEQPTLNFTLTARGFTGHEHYPYFNIINMNGRLYDPVIGRMFSPDKYVQLPEFTQSFNRYSYAFNNPLKYKDPTGQFGMHFGLGDGMGKIMDAVNSMTSELEKAFTFQLNPIEVFATTLSDLSKYNSFMRNVSSIFAFNQTMSGGGGPYIPKEFNTRLMKTGNYKKPTTLQNKLNTMVNHDRKGMLGSIGEGDATFLLGTRSNVIEYGRGDYSYEWGNIFSKEIDPVTNARIQVNGFSVEGVEIGRTSDGYRRYGNNVIIISKIAVREMWLGGLHETLYHEWWHASSFFMGEVDYWRKNYPDNFKLQLEYQAHKAIYHLFPKYLYAKDMMKYYYDLIK